MNNMAMGVSLSGQFFKEMFGVVITYDFYPVKLVFEERSESFFSFVTSLCGIVGGDHRILLYYVAISIQF